MHSKDSSLDVKHLELSLFTQTFHVLTVCNTPPLNMRENQYVKAGDKQSVNP